MKATFIIVEVFVGIIFFPILLLVGIALGLVKVYSALHRAFKEAYFIEKEEY